MPILTESLSVWEIAHRWAGDDPDHFRLRLPLLVKDYCRVLMAAILDGHITCETLTLAKRPSDSKADPVFYIRSHLEAVNSCIWGKSYNRRLLKWASINRYEFQEWCENLAIPLPDFWFPNGWNRHFTMPEFGTPALWARHVEPREPGDFSVRYDVPVMQPEEVAQENLQDNQNQSLRHNQITKVSVQRMAAQLWKEDPKRTISDMARDENLRKYCGATHYTEGALIKWLSPVAPKEIRGKRGRPRKKPDKEGE